MDLKQLQEFFHLQANPELFQAAISPPSCGGRDTFDRLAIEGDNLIDTALINLFQQQGIRDAGELTHKKKQFHNERTLSRLGSEFLELHKFFSPIDPNYQIQISDIKETVEALIAASHHQNGSSISLKIIEQLYLTAIENEYLDFDYISELLLLLQKELNNPLLQWDEPVQAGGGSHNPIWTLNLTVQYQGKTYQEASGPFPNLKLAKREAAMKIYHKLMNLSSPISKQVSIPQKLHEVKQASQSLLERQIIFSKIEPSENNDPSIMITVNTGQYLKDWATEKAKKKPFSLLVLMTTILPQEIRGSSWYATTELGELVLLNLQILTDHYFEVGFSPSSKSQARNIAAKKLIQTSHLLDWLAQNHAKTLK